MTTTELVDEFKAVVETGYAPDGFASVRSYMLARGEKLLPILAAALTPSPTPAPLVGGGSNKWLIISMKEGRGAPYWRPEGRGYTDSVTDAGKYTYEEARLHTNGSHGDDEMYCMDDPALHTLISNQSMVRGKELGLYLQLLATPAPAGTGAGADTLLSPERIARITEIASQIIPAAVEVVCGSENYPANGHLNMTAMAASHAIDELLAENKALRASLSPAATPPRRLPVGFEPDAAAETAAAYRELGITPPAATSVVPEAGQPWGRASWEEYESRQRKKMQDLADERDAALLYGEACEKRRMELVEAAMRPLPTYDEMRSSAAPTPSTPHA